VDDHASGVTSRPGRRRTRAPRDPGGGREHPSPVRVGLVSLGCPKNLVDSEKMLGRLVGAGCDIVPDPVDADVIVVNTCGFIADAKKESIAAILDMARLKNGGRRLIVTGCLVERYLEDLRAELPEVDAFVRIGEQESIARVVGVREPRCDSRCEPPRALTGPPYLAYLKIADGCSQKCSFCAIPFIRGPQRSRPVEALVDEASELASRGVTELILVAQDTTSYGQDLPRRPRLAALLRHLARVRGLRWIRVNYMYPKRITRELMETVAGEERLCKYIDVPFQHADRDLLGAMRRGGDGRAHLQLIERLRSSIPGVFIRSAFIVGFPGETPSRFRRLLDFVRRAEIDHVGVFTYSAEEGTAAEPLGDPVPAREKRRRRASLMTVQRSISARRLAGRIGQRHTALVEGVGRTYYLCRIGGQAPDIDGRTRLRATAASRRLNLEPGDYVPVRITGAGAYDFQAEVDDVR